MKAKVKANGVLVRKSNTNMSPVIGSVAPGTTIDIEAEYGEWVKLADGGWVKACYTEATDLSGAGSGGSGGSGGADVCVANFEITIEAFPSVKGFPEVENITCDKTDTELLEAWENGNLVAIVHDTQLNKKATAHIYKNDGGSDWMSWYFGIEYAMLDAPEGNYGAGKYVHRRVQKAVDCPENEFMGSNSCSQMLVEFNPANTKANIFAGSMKFTLDAVTS